jgi:hypothetical protein
VVIPGRIEDANPESRDSGSGPSDHPGMTSKMENAALKRRVFALQQRSKK